MSILECPLCSADFRGAPMSEDNFVHNTGQDKNNPTCEEQQAMWGCCHCLPYGDLPAEERFFSRLIGIEIQGIYDGILFWQCPDCGGRWHRFEDQRMRAKAEPYLYRDAEP